MKSYLKKFKIIPAAFFILTLTGIGGNHAFAQQPDNQGNQNPNDQEAMQKIESLKMAYLTNQLNLSPSEAQKFWPVYNQYESQLQQINRERRENQLQRNNLKDPSDQQIEQSLNRDFQLRQQALQLRENYRKQFQQVIPPRKVSRLYQSEKDFNMKLIQELRRRQDNGAGEAAGNTQRQMQRQERQQEIRQQRQHQEIEMRRMPRMRPNNHPVRINPGRGR